MIKEWISDPLLGVGGFHRLSTVVHLGGGQDRDSLGAIEKKEPSFHWIF